MLDRGELARIALRHDTTMARALLRALGISQRPRPRRTRGGAEGAWRYDGAGECFRNRILPAILRRG